ncbi:MAG: VOC family protein [Reyranella sp.]|uniref:VOC family protein n=1 Tax=Reyranella sp. TaxID=1929291 RepID=UPI00120D65EE|nr:VOC family protein [Reyranella sp.]TAJ37313.1 MAG: VOC family protein [Reyranella sp.]
MPAKQKAPQQTLRAHATVHDAKAAIAFYVKAFGAVELFRLVEPAGRVGHAEIRIGDSVLMLNDEYPDFGAKSPASVGGSPVAFRIEVPDADAAVGRAVKAGATVVRPAQDEFYGDRMGMVACPFGYRWSLAAPKEQVSPAEMQKRWSKMLSGG